MSWVAPLPSFSSSPGIPSNHRLICREGDQPNILWISQELVEYLQDSGCNFCEHFGMSKRIGQLLKLKQKTSDICAVVFFTQVLMHIFFDSLVFFSYELPLHVCCRLQSDSVHIDASHQSLCGKIVQCRQAQLWVECRFMGFTCLGSLCKFISSAERGAHGLHVKWRQPLFASMPRHCPACHLWILSLRCIILCILHHWMLY